MNHELQQASMKLSEAILLGTTTASAAPYLRHNGGSACAIGMAENALGLPDHGAEEQWPWLYLNCSAPCGCRIYRNPVKRQTRIIEDAGFAIAHIFNEHVCGDKTWTIERLVAWVETIEPQPELAAQPSPEFAGRRAELAAKEPTP